MLQHGRPVPSLVVAALTTLLAAMAFASAPASAADLFSNQAPITIPKAGKALPYPTAISVDGLSRPISDLSVTLHGFTHPNPEDVDILLVPPHGYSVILMSDTCGNSELTNATFLFPSSGTNPPMGGTCGGGVVYRTTNVGGGDVWPDAPSGPTNGELSYFHGDDPNGLWYLYVIDDEGPDSGGKIARGWSLTIGTAPPDAFVPGTGSAGFADPYPITRAVSGKSGVISDMDVDVLGVFHRRPDDLDLLLVGPRGQKVMLMSDACGAMEGGVASFRFYDGVSKLLPDAGPCTGGGSYRPADHEPGESLPSPAAAGPYETALSAFNSTDPNGEWRLYAYDDSFGEVGWFRDRFRLGIKTRPEADVAFADAAAAVPEGRSGSLTLTRTGPAELGKGTVTVTSAPRIATSGSDFRPVATAVEFAAGQTQNTISVEALADSLPEGAETFALTIGQATGDAKAATPETAVVTIRDPATGRGVPGIDRNAPVVGGVTLAPAAFAVGRRSTARAAARGTTIRYSLSEAARVTLRFQRAIRGRRVGRSCRPVTARTRRRRPCRRYVAAGTLRRAGRSGRNRVAFSGRIGRRALGRGAYRLVVTAVDAAGNRSTSGPKGFRIVR